MKLKKLIYIFLIITLLPVFSSAEEYPYLPTALKEKVISLFEINTAGKTQLYERVNIYGSLDAWMIAWFDDDCKIITGITDLGDVIYYSISSFDETSPVVEENKVDAEQGESAAREFMSRVMPSVSLELVDKGDYEYTFAQCHNGIRIMGREATVLVDGQSGSVIYYKGFAPTESSFELMDTLVTPESAFDVFYNDIGLELVYNTAFNDDARIKTIRPMYILNRSNHTAVDAQTGETTEIVMHDYNYYYGDSYYDERFYYDNNIRTEEKIFMAEKQVYGYGLSPLTGLPLSLEAGYSAQTVSGKLSYYSDASGRQNIANALQINIVPTHFFYETETFATMFDEGNLEWFNSVNASTPLVFARAYVDIETGRLLDFETVKNSSYISETASETDFGVVDRFVSVAADGLNLKYYGMKQISSHQYTLCYAKYADGIRVIGEGACVVYDSMLNSVTDYSLVVTDSELFPATFMKSQEELKETVKKELKLELYYVDKDPDTKFVVYDAENRFTAFDPVTGNTINKNSDSNSSLFLNCSVGNEIYMINGTVHTAPVPKIYSEKLFVPLETLCFALGYDISVSANKISINGHRNIIELNTSSKECNLNGDKIFLDLPPTEFSGNIYISAQTIRSVFGVFINWSVSENIICIVQ